MVNPLDEATIQVLKTTSGSEIVARTAVRSAIERLVNRVYPEQIDGDATVLPNARFSFEPREPRPATPSPAEPASSPSSQPADEEPFDFSTRTLLSSRRNLQELDDENPAAPDERFGTLIAHPLPASALEPPGTAPPRTEPPRTEPPTPDALARIEQRLDAIAGAIERVQKRIDALDMTLMRFMNR
jgi:hypothetical protein